MIVDDDVEKRGQIRQIIASSSDRVQECVSSDDALSRLDQFKPDCVTVDAGMAGAFETIRTIRSALPATRVICVTLNEQPGDRRAAAVAGASGFVALKNNLPDLHLFVATKRLLLGLQVGPRIF